jgi:hypothetical protein
VLGQILAQMKDRSGHIKIPGFYDDVRALSDAERAEWKKLPFNETQVPEGARAPRVSLASRAIRRSSVCGRGRRSR